MNIIKNIILLSGLSMASQTFAEEDFVILVEGDYEYGSTEDPVIPDPNLPQSGVIHTEIMSAAANMMVHREITLKPGFEGSKLEFRTIGGTGEVMLSVVKGVGSPTTGARDCQSDNDVDGVYTQEVCELGSLRAGVYTAEIYAAWGTPFDDVEFRITLID